MAARNAGRGGTGGGAGGGASVVFDRYLARLRSDVVRGAGDAVEQAGPRVARMIRERTALGIDRHGRRFAPYRPSTVRKRRRAGKQTGRVDLRFTGRMLDSLGERKGLVFRSVELYFADAARERVARFLYFGTKRMSAREFFGVSPAEAVELRAAFRRTVVASLPKDRRRRIVLTVIPE